ncbi:MAG: hypothetical protein ACP5G0_13815 [Desulfomonilia bacterium]
MGSKKMWLLTLIVSLMGVCTYVSPASGDDVILNGYVFSDDSTDLAMNQYFSNYARGVDFSFTGYGYGDFKGYELSQLFSQYYSYQGIACVVIRELGYIPRKTTEDGEPSITMDPYTRYFYYAKDIENNIHLINVTGDTTLLYPDAPETGEAVFSGYVEDVGYALGDVSDCVVIARDALPYGFPSSMREYLIPGSGVYAISYNWDGRVNGFSTDGNPPELAEKDKSTWEEWVDDHCFISVCSPWGGLSR